MLVVLGNNEPFGAPGPTITTTSLEDVLNEDGTYAIGYIMGTDADEVRKHLSENPGQVTHLPGQQAILGVCRSWLHHSNVSPAWVVVEPQERDPENAADFERFLADFWGCPRGYPTNLEETHYTVAGPPGVGPEGEISND